MLVPLPLSYLPDPLQLLPMGPLSIHIIFPGGKLSSLAAAAVTETLAAEIQMAGKLSSGSFREI